MASESMARLVQLESCSKSGFEHGVSWSVVKSKIETDLWVLLNVDKEETQLI